MKNRIPFQILRFFLFIFLFACSSPEHENMAVKVNKATHQLNEIDSLHLKILLSTCDEIGKQPYLENEFKYWELNQPNFENVVLYESELDCGFVGGTCGNTIAVSLLSRLDFNFARRPLVLLSYSCFYYFSI